MTSTLAFARAPRIPPASASAFSRLSNITTAPVGAVDHLDHLDQLLRGQDAVALGEELRDLVPVDAGLEVAPPSGPASC
jgi:hypothetical protein